MVLMGLEIGGAETHVVELAKELARRGHTVHIASNGGVYEKEIAWYLQQTGKYGVPLDSRQVYTKSDWIAWCAAMAEDNAAKLLTPIADYLENAPDRVPFGDWYDTESGIHHMFVGRSVQGGMFMPLLYSKKQN